MIFEIIMSLLILSSFIVLLINLYHVNKIESDLTGLMSGDLELSEDSVDESFMVF